MEHQAIYNTHSSVKVIRSEVAYDSDNNEVILDQSLVDAELTRLQAEYDSLAYARSRKQEYDKLPQFEMQFDDQQRWHFNLGRFNQRD